MLIERKPGVREPHGDVVRRPLVDHVSMFGRCLVCVVPKAGSWFMGPRAASSANTCAASRLIATAVNGSMRYLLLAVAALSLGMPTIARAQPVPLATPAGPVQGAIEGGVAVFRGLPYAQPPTGALRWRAPQPLAPWTELRAASAVQPACPQKRGMSLEGGGDPGRLDEDCLYLNIFAPPIEPNTKRPVMVWIHGGALIFGAGSLPIYDASALARRGAVVVTINYRLGPLGFFAHPALEAESPSGPVNFGMLDQIAALQWVRRNIAAFGGDAANVTIFGQSAGAQSVLALMASPLAMGLFDRAIAQSAFGVPSQTRAKALQKGVVIASAVGLNGIGASAAALRQVPADRLASLDWQALSISPGFIVGDKAVPQPLLQAFQRGSEAAVPLVIGSTSDDGSVAFAFGIEPGALVAKLGGAKRLVRLLYPGIADDAELGRQVARDAVFTAFARRIAYLHVRRAPTWRYYFDHGRPPGAGHGAEVPYVMGTTASCQCLGAPASAADQAVEQRLGDRWVSFARTGEPDAGSSWPVDNRGRGVVLEIGTTDTARPGFMSARINTIITGLNVAAKTR